MSSISYYEAIKGNQNAFSLRVKLVDYALRYGNKPAAREFDCNIKTVRKWLARYKEHGLAGLRSRSKRPHNSPNKTPPKEEKEIKELRISLKRVSPRRMHREFGIKQAPSTIYRIIKELPNYKPKRWKKHKKKQDLREVKAKLKVFEKIQIDIKELKDIPNYLPYMRREKLPKYQFTARDVKSGALFFAFAHSKDCANATTFCAYLLEHLKRHGVDIKKINIQTDNDGAFVGNWRVNSYAPFINLIEKVYKATHLRIPPAAPTYNSDVETSHARIEEELYDVEEFDDLWLLLSKALSYQAYFNIFRPNTYKQEKTPIQIIAEEKGFVDFNLLILQPVVLDQNVHLYFNIINPSKATKRVHYLPELPIFAEK